MANLYAVVFGSGALLMALEVLGSRVMAPHFGSSVYVWGSLISVFMAALSAGYFVGGMLADARPHHYTLANVLAGAGALTLLVPAYGERVAESLAHLGPRLGALTAAMVIFFPPTVLLGLVSPLAVRLGVLSLEQVGASSGRLSAVSTAGSIAGTLITTFFLIPLTGTKQLITFTGAGLVLLAALPLLASQRTRWAGGAAAAALLITLWGPSGLLAGHLEVVPGGVLRTVYATESAYHNIRVMDGNGARYLRFDQSWQTAMDLADPFRSAVPYPDYFHLAMAQNPDIRDVLVIGLGGGAAPKRFWKDYPGVRVDAVELDPVVVDVARQYFSVPEDDRLRLLVGDGRRYLETNAKKYDLIMVDAYYSDSIPFHLTTREFLQAMKLRLNRNGVAAFNLIGALDGPKSTFARSFYKTVAEAFPTRYMVPVDWSANPSNTALFNLMLFASEAPQLDKPALIQAARAAEQKLSVQGLTVYANDLYTPAISTADVSVLTDDHAPVDNLIKVVN